MGTTYEDLPDHEGYIAQVWDDGTLHSGGSAEDAQRVVGWRAACSHYTANRPTPDWTGRAYVERLPGEDAWPEWEDLPALDAEWEAHLTAVRAKEPAR